MFNFIKNFYKKNTLLSILISVSFILILTCAIIFKQHPLKTLPLFISLVIMLLTANVNRYAFLLGSFNSILYCYYYATVGLYSSLAYALAVSFPLQLISFFTWQKKSKGSFTTLRRMNAKQLILFLAVFFLSWATLYISVSFFDPSYSILDTTISILGIAVTVLTLLRFSEYIFLQTISGIITIVMHITIVADGDISNITYVIFSIYSLTCIIMAIINICRSHPEIRTKNKISNKKTA